MTIFSNIYNKLSATQLQKFKLLKENGFSDEFSLNISVMDDKQIAKAISFKEEYNASDSTIYEVISRFSEQINQGLRQPRYSRRSI